MKDRAEILFWKLAKWLIRRDYGADCPDYEEECPSCRAKDMIAWIEEHIELLSVDN